jgi:Protein of unknown function (DUF2961)
MNDAIAIDGSRAELNRTVGWGRRRMLLWSRGLGIVFLLLIANHVSAATAEPPVVPVGLDAYRMWDQWADQRIGVRAYMRSTYDRAGGNESADASHFLFQSDDDLSVPLDVAGPGILYFVRYNHWHGSPWHYVVDGTDHVVQESATADPRHPRANSVFMPEQAFPAPLAVTWSATKGADLSWVPIGFERSFQMAYGRTHYGTGYYIYHQIVPGTRLSRPIQAWTGAERPDQDVLDLLDRSGQDLVPRADSAEGKRLGIHERSDAATLPAGAATELAKLDRAPAILRAIEVSVSRESAMELSKVRLRIAWDDREAASVDAPLPLFFGAGTLYNRDGREYLVKAFPVTIRFDEKRVYLACFFPMPFFRSARIELVNSGDAIADVRWAIRWTPLEAAPNQVGYFHATYRDHPQPELGKDLVLLDTASVEGGGDWSGQFIGTSFIFSHHAELRTLEGDPRFFFDDSSTPQAQGTGTEEWGGGGDYWGGLTMSLPLAGHPVGAQQGNAKSPDDAIESAYRFLLADLMPFGKNARIQFEHGGTNESKEHYETVAYWYGIPAASLVLTDELKVADAESEKKHHYVSPDASPPEQITSRYEWGVDRVGTREVYPTETDSGRHTTGASEFTLQLRRDNLGVLLRRKLDYAFPNQRAEVFIADSSQSATSPTADWKPAGVWYLAGSNTCVYSAPKDELGPAEHRIQTSNRRFRDDEFLIPRALTEGRSAIRVRVKFTEVRRPLFPGQPLPPLAWSELKYSAYCFVRPDFEPGR